MKTWWKDTWRDGVMRAHEAQCADILAFGSRAERGEHMNGPDVGFIYLTRQGGKIWTDGFSLVVEPLEYVGGLPSRFQFWGARKSPA